MKKNLLKKVSLTVVFILFAQWSFAQTEDEKVWQKVITNSQGIKTIVADLQQEIYYPHKRVSCYTGKVWSDEKRRYRLDYQTPFTQVVIGNQQVMYWYYPEQKTVYQFKPQRNSLNFQNSFSNFVEKIAKDADFSYQGKKVYSLFKSVYCYQVKLADKKTKFEIYVDPKKSVILEKICLNKDNVELTREIYTNYCQIAGYWIPQKIEVQVRTAEGSIRSISYYKKIKINKKLTNEMFTLNLPYGVKKKMGNYVL